MEASLLYAPAVIYAYATVNAVAVRVDCAALGNVCEPLQTGPMWLDPQC